TQSPPPCDGPDLDNEAVEVQYKNNTTGGAWTTFHTFMPGFGAVTGWNNYSFPIPNGATLGGPGNQVQFRWIQFNASSPTYDLWGIDNVDITLNPPCGVPYTTTFLGPNVPFGYNFDTITVSPLPDSVIYSVFVSNGALSCTDSITIHVERPTIVSSLIASPCAGTDTLDAQATITANCYYTLELRNWGPGASNGWSVNGTNPPQYHQMHVNVSKFYYSNFTMLNGSSGATETHQIPVTNGDLLELYFAGVGGNSNECSYTVYDSQGNVALTQSGNQAVTGFGATPLMQYFNNQINFTVINGGSGYNTPPFGPGNPAPVVTLSGGGCLVDNITANVVWNPPPVGGVITSVQSFYNPDPLNPTPVQGWATGCTSAPTVTVTGGGGSGAVIQASISSTGGAIPVSCPATATYLYSWQNITAGGTIGLSDPNVQNPLVTVSNPTQFEVLAYDSLNPNCTVTDTVIVPGNPGNGSFDVSLIGNNPMCSNASPNLTVILASNSIPQITSGNFYCDIEDGNGNIILPNFYIDGSTLPLSVPLPAGVLPIPLVSGTYSFTITNMVLDIGGTLCPVAVNNPTQTITVNDPLLEGTPPITAIELCSSMPLSNMLYISWSVNPDPNGTWSYLGTNPPGGINPPGSNLPFNGFNYDLDPGLFGAGTHLLQYLVGSVAGCPAPTPSLVTVNILNAPSAGTISATPIYCENNPALPINLLNLFDPAGGFPNPPTPDFYDVTTNPAGVQIINPGSWPQPPIIPGVYSLENRAISQGNCPPDVETVVIEILEAPTVTIGTDDPNNSICSSDPINLSFNIIGGIADYNIDYVDPNGITQNIQVDGNGNDVITGLPIPITPPNIGINLYTVTNISDVNCSNNNNSSVALTVVQGPNSGIGGGNYTICEDDFTIYNLNLPPPLGFFPTGGDPGGYWQYQGITPNNGTFTAWNPAANTPIDPFGMYEYTVTDPTGNCPDVSSQITISPATPPNTGIAINDDICVDAPNPYNLNNLLDGSQDSPGYANWIDNATNTIVPFGQINPVVYGVGTHIFSYQITDPTGNCTNNGSTPPLYETQAILTIHELPSVDPATFTATSPVPQGSSSTINIDMLTGSPPFTINVIGNETPPPAGPGQSNNTFTITSGMSGSGSISPNWDPNQNPVDISIVSIVDFWGCSTNQGLSTPVIVDPFPEVTTTISSTTPCEGDIVNLTITGLKGLYPLTVYYEINGFTQPPITVLDPLSFPPTIIPVHLSPNWTNTANSIVFTQIVDNAVPPNYCPPSLLPNPILININPRPIISTFTITDPNNEICEGDDAILEFNFSTGTPPFNVNIIDQNSITTAITNLTGMNNQQHTISPQLTATAPPYPLAYNYNVTGYSDANNCLGTFIPASVNVIVHPVPVISISQFLRGGEICEGDTIGIGLSINANIYANPPEYDITIDNDIGEPIINKTINQNGIIVLGSGSGDSVLVTPSNTINYTITNFFDPKTNCGAISASSNALLTVNQKPNLEITSTADTNEVCFGDKSYINFTFTNGTSPWTINYNSNGFPVSLGPWNDTTTVTQILTATSNYKFTSITDGKGCSRDLLKEFDVIVNPLPVAELTADNRYICKDDTSQATLKFEISSTTIPNNFKVIYNLNGNQIIIPDSIGNIHTLQTNTTGTYNIFSVVDRNGCKSIQNGDSINIIANPLPTANFIFYPDPTDMDDPFITFGNNSEGNSISIWSTYSMENNNITPGSYWTDTMMSNEPFVYEYPAEADTHYVFLKVVSDSGCVDIHSDTVIINQSFWIHVPDAFSPDNDMINDHFLPIVNGVQEYSLSIYNRMGQRVFETNDYISQTCPGGCTEEELEALIVNCMSGCSSAWDGKINSNYSQTSNFVYNIVLTDLNGKIISRNGSITLIR
ncbi:MAG: hypothetical protein CMD06_01325, partial [Flavobacteriales bacterium]|nr:hypothetical protein [Flavobacteriales bacterium]